MADGLAHLTKALLAGRLVYSIEVTIVLSPAGLAGIYASTESDATVRDGGTAFIKSQYMIAALAKPMNQAYG